MKDDRDRIADTYVVEDYVAVLYCHCDAVILFIRGRAHQWLISDLVVE